MNLTLEEKIYKKFQTWRGIVLRPAISLFALLKISPETVSYIGVFLMVGFIFFVNSDQKVAFWFLTAAIIFDSLDGSLARFLKVESDKGKFTDVLMDNLNFTLFIIGLIIASLLSGLTGAVYIYFMLLVKVLMIVKKNIKKESDWLIRPMVGAFPNIFVYSSYVIFGIYVFFGADYFNFSSAIFSGFLILKAVFDYFVIRSTLFQKTMN